MASHQLEQQAQVDRLGTPGPTAGRRPATGRFAGLRVLDGRSVVTVCLAGGADREVTLAGTPNSRLARSLTAGFRRMAWVRIDASEAEVRCEAAGIARRAHHCRLPLAAALALAEADVPTVVRLRPGGA